MPIARIEVRKKWSRQEKDLLIQALHESMVECLKIPEYDKIIRFLEYEPEDFVVPPGCSENYVLVDISLFSGRSLDAKRALYKSVVARFTEIGVPKKEILIVLHDVPRDNWGIRGGIPASEVDLGFKIDI
ncbi:MAG TPA: tautomerase family protein [Dongiaceae bacterium]|nr:tautomerase family protein [Dongiaceae bacterium]